MNLSILWEDGETVGVQVAGKVTQAMAKPLEDPLGELLGPSAYSRRVVLDMRDVEALDSSGIGWLLVCHKRFREAGGQFVIHSLTPMARNVLKVLNMQTVLKMAGSEQKAIGLLGGEQP